MKKKNELWLMSYVAKGLAQCSKCVKHKVGAVIFKDGYILGTGYNGTPKGCLECNEMNFENISHHDWSASHEIHAEINAIINALKSNPFQMEGVNILCTLEPCVNCLKTCAAVGINTVYYLEQHFDYTEQQQLALELGIELQKINPEDYLD